jgi:hypothetical protein
LLDTRPGIYLVCKSRFESYERKCDIISRNIWRHDFIPVSEPVTEPLSTLKD